ncbi:MAG: hypothetical protein FD165_2351 [Gammaproteobacteria bacterium]|nr:MAG: hypothetical protein FD165_2351 [Gammaproteobacteria bacterium]TND01429.1 MAG: hypothetical protein FD120_2602 [Gammaproteobacteria bacterium]
MKYARIGLYLIVVSFPVTSPAMAIDDLVVSGFFTVGATKAGSSATTDNGGITDDVGFENDTRIGLQLLTHINPQMTMTAQMVGRGSDNGYAADFEWAYIDYALSDSFNVRAGKLKFPTYLISDYVDVGYAYPWIRPPEEVYFSNPLTTISGVDVLFRTRAGDMDLLVQPYIGSSKGESGIVPQETLMGIDQAVTNALIPSHPLQGTVGTVQRVDFSAENFIGINASIGNQYFTARAGYLETDVTAAAFGVVDDKASFGSVGATIDWRNTVVYSEYFEREIQGGANMAFPNQKGWYTTLGYRFGNWLPHMTYAEVGDNDNPAAGCSALGCGVPIKQHSTAVGVRHDFARNAALKLEVKRVSPDAAVAGMPKRGLFLTAPGEDVNIYSIALDTVF